MRGEIARYDGRLPRISIITPSYNQARFLRRTIQSVLDQDYPNLEYIVIDGGSTDGSVEIIRQYEERIAYWVSEPDHGQAHAINKGIRRATGEWVGWQNSDDIYYPNSFRGVVRAARLNPEAHLVIGDLMLLDNEESELRELRYVRPTYRSLLAEGMVLSNQSAFWRRSVHDQLGFLDEDLVCAFDYEWFLRLTERYRAAHVREIWGGLRAHTDTKTSHMQDKFNEEFRKILAGRSFPPYFKRTYQLRRLVLTLAQGDIRYVARGLVRRALASLDLRIAAVKATLFRDSPAR